MHTVSLSARRPLRMVAAGVVIALAGAFSATAFAAPHHMHGGGGMMHGRMLERMLDGVNATDAQRAQIKQIADSARADLKAQRESGRALREQAMALFTQPNVDARAAEALRQQMLAQHDQASSRMLKAMLDASSVLTPEQRTQLGERIRQRRELFERHRHERRAIETPRS